MVLRGSKSLRTRNGKAPLGGALAGLLAAVLGCGSVDDEPPCDAAGNWNVTITWTTGDCVKELSMDTLTVTRQPDGSFVVPNLQGGVHDDDGACVMEGTFDEMGLPHEGKAVHEVISILITERDGELQGSGHLVQTTTAMDGTASTCTRDMVIVGNKTP